MNYQLLSPRAHAGIRKLLLAALCALSPVAASAEQVQAAPVALLPSVTVTPVRTAPMVGRVPVSGTLVPQQEVLVYPEVSGFPIDTLSVDIGDSVAAGQILATLNARTLTAQLAQAQAELARAQAAVGQARNQIKSATANATQARSVQERTQSLLNAGTTTQADLDQAIANAQTADAGVASANDGLLVAQAQLQQAQAQLDIATLNLDHATLRAPVAGVISARNGQIGGIAAPGGEPIFRIIKGGEIEVQAEVIENVLGQINVGAQADLSIAGVGDVTGIVRQISPIVDPLNRLGSIRISLQGSTDLRSGLFANGWVITAQRETLAVPTSAVLSESQGNFVLVVKDDGLLEKRAVTAGLIWNDLREIVTGLNNSETVVTKAGAFFGDGDRINPVPAEATP